MGPASKIVLPRIKSVFDKSVYVCINVLADFLRYVMYNIGAGGNRGSALPLSFLSRDGPIL